MTKKGNIDIFLDNEGIIYKFESKGKHTGILTALKPEGLYKRKIKLKEYIAVKQEILKLG
jgi:hypothetical protein